MKGFLLLKERKSQNQKPSSEQKIILVVLGKKFELLALSRALSNTERTDNQDNRGLAGLGSVSVSRAQCTQYDLYFSLLLSPYYTRQSGHSLWVHVFACTALCEEA